ncbi:MAG: radical SAM family heme chaperone HemW [Acidobacteria bacterium]|nr:radical SAM family heme chaperone HemW [Acidobacteriota bacterium]
MFTEASKVKLGSSAGVYLHIPFCKSRCSYCDFATDVFRDQASVQRYVDALCREILSEPPASAGGQVDTVYFGGGTPSLLDPKQAEQVIDAVRNRFDISRDAEITMEMNPATVSAGSLAGYRELGVNRASFGVQTFNDRDLKLLARGHDANDARQTFKLLRDAGFANISFDLIAGLPGQTLADWARNLDEALAMGPEHLSLYLLEVHQGTPLAEQLRSGRRPMPDEDAAAAMYELLLDRTASAGLLQYEISNFARPGFESRHNTKYWRLEPVYGFGVSAHSFDGVNRYWNERDTARYVELIEERYAAEAGRETADAASEFVFLGLRMKEGIGFDEYHQRSGFDLFERCGPELARLIDAGLVEADNSRLRLTKRGMLFSNDVFVSLL